MGAVAKAVATILTFPLQVAQSRLRAVKKGSNQNLGSNRQPELQGMVPCLHAIWLEGGIRRLYAGLGTKLLQTVTQAAFLFAFYEKVHRVIRSSSTAPRQLFSHLRDAHDSHVRRIGSVAMPRARLLHAMRTGKI